MYEHDTNTFIKASNYFKETLHASVKTDSIAQALAMFDTQKIMAASLASAAHKAVCKRRSGTRPYSVKMLQKESGQIESVYWYRRHIKKIDVKMLHLETRLIKGRQTSDGGAVKRIAIPTT